MDTLFPLTLFRRSSNERFQAELRQATSKESALDVELRMAKGEIANMKVGMNFEFFCRRLLSFDRE